MAEPRVSVIIPSWNARDVLARCLDSLATQEVRGGFETIVVDNASSDGTAEMLRGRRDPFRVISNDENVGFSVANNQAAREARGAVLFFLNSDTELLSPDVLEVLARALEADGVAMAGPMLVNPDGSLQPSCAAHPSISRALIVGAGVHRWLPNAVLGRVAPEFWSHDAPIDTGWVMGAAVAVRADVFRGLGGFWPIMYSEEQDLAHRAQERGMRVRFESSVRVMHVGNHSNRQRWPSAVRAARIASAEISFLRAHYSRRRAAAIRAITGTAYGLRAIAHRVLRHEQAAAVYRAMAHVYAAGMEGVDSVASEGPRKGERPARSGAL
jgi:GT2 family glycosyltransferase